MGKVYTTRSVEQTQNLAKDFAKNLKGGDVIVLYGDLGYGKTTFVQGVAEGLGIQQRIISPTFILVREYEIKNKKENIKNTNKKVKRFYHIDLYRIESAKDIQGLGLEEILNDKNVIVAIEWAEKLGSLLPNKRIDIYFEYLSENKRKINIT